MTVKSEALTLRTVRAYSRHRYEGQLSFLHEYLKPSLVELRRYNMPHIGRILITDRVVYFTPYPRNKRADYGKVVKMRRGGPLSEGLARLFDSLWQNAPKA